MNKKIGYIGLGKMGENMVLRLFEKGWDVVANDTNEETIKKVEEKGIAGAYSIKDMVNSLQTPRLIWIMVPHQVVDNILEDLIPFLSDRDVVIDGGNSNYKETLRRVEKFQRKNIKFLDAGVSGGPGGARDGACVMVGGEKNVFQEYEELFADISAPNAYGYMGRSGSGHFVKMVHNGIEYGMMQAIGEGFDVLKKSSFDLNLKEVTRVYNNKSVIESRLVNWLGNAFEQYGEDLAEISGKVSASGEGKWTVQAANELNVSTPIIENSVDFREQSQNNPSYTGQVVSALRNQFGGHEVKNK